MKVLFDSEIFYLQKYGGISRYVTELVAGLSLDGSLSYPKYLFSENEHLLQKGFVKWDLSFFEKTNKWPLLYKGTRFFRNQLLKLDQKRINSHYNNQDFNVFHLTYYNNSWERKNDKPVVLTVYDMIQEVFLNDYFQSISPETVRKTSNFDKVDHIISISNATKQAILDFMPSLNPDKIEVIHLAASVPNTPWLNLNIDLPSKYLLFIGNRKSYKNFYWLAKSLSIFLKREKITLLCAGGGEFDLYDRNFLRENELDDYVKHLSFKSDSELFHIYSKAICFIFPSNYEGFGIPVLESLNASCPAVLTNIPVFKEVAEEGAFYFEKGNSEQLIEIIQSLQKPGIRSEMIETGLQRSLNFSWNKCVKEHKDFYESIIYKQ